jgi:hypothetical protein
MNRGYRNYSQAREEFVKAQHALPNNARIFEFLGLMTGVKGDLTKVFGTLNAQSQPLLDGKFCALQGSTPGALHCSMRAFEIATSSLLMRCHSRLQTNRQAVENSDEMES